MATKGAAKIIEALTQLMEGYVELQQSVERDFGGREGEDEGELSSEVDTAIVTEVRAAVESVMEDEDYSAEEMASVISMLTDAVEEIDPDVFDQEEDGEEEEEDEDDSEDDEDEDLDLDEDDEDEE
jgi:ribonuclease E